MANKTVKDAKTVHGTNPQFLIEKIIRTRIYENRYWKEDCFGLTADLVVDKGAELRYIGGTYGGNIKTAPFLCLTLKLLQIQPEKDIIIEFIRQENFKYIRALGAFYLRLVGNSLDIYKYLEPLYNDYRKLRRMTKMGTFDVIYMDEFIDSLLREDRVFDVILPRLTKRYVHEENGELPKRISLIEEDLYAEDDDDDEAKDDQDANKASSDSEDDRRNRETKKQRRSRSPKDRHHHRSRRMEDYDDDDDYDHDHRRSRRSSVSPKNHRHHDPHESRPHHRHRSNSRERTTATTRKPSHQDRDGRRSRTPERKSMKKRSGGRRDDPEPQPPSGSSSSSTKGKSEADEIAEMNALRAKLGLKPLRP